VFDAVDGRVREGRLGTSRTRRPRPGPVAPGAPFFVRESRETLLAGDVVTLEPGQYVSGVGGIPSSTIN